MTCAPSHNGSIVVRTRANAKTAAAKANATLEEVQLALRASRQSEIAGL